MSAAIHASGTETASACGCLTWLIEGVRSPIEALLLPPSDYPDTQSTVNRVRTQHHALFFNHTQHPIAFHVSTGSTRCTPPHRNIPRPLPAASNPEARTLAALHTSGAGFASREARQIARAYLGAQAA
eukprot:3163928-Rhodomonas_salina.1